MLSSPKNRKILKDFLFFRTIMQQQNKFVSEKTKSETHFLLALDAYPQSSAGYIQKLINIKQSSFSTLAKELEVRGLIQNTKDLKDSRSKLLSLTSKGKQKVDLIDQELNHQFELRKNNVSKKELERLTELFGLIADYYQMEPENPRPIESALRSAQRRFTRCFGISSSSSSSFVGLNVSPTTWHILFLLEYAVDELTIKDISQKLTISHNTVSTQIKNLFEQGLIQKKAVVGDARSSILELTALGKKKLKSYEDCIIESLNKALSASLILLIQELNTLLSRFYHIFNDLEYPLMVKRFTSPANIILARTFLVENLVKQNNHHYMPESIASATLHKVYALYRHKDLVAVAQFNYGEELNLDCCAWLSSLKLKDLQAFINYILSARRRSKPRNITFKPLHQALKNIRS